VEVPAATTDSMTATSTSANNLERLIACLSWFIGKMKLF
jgi:hypothetical protein